jgi:tellurite resistance protein
MIEIFSTNITNENDALIITCLVHQVIPDGLVNFDLEDCDRILREEDKMKAFDANEIINLLEKKGFQCNLLKE